MKNVYLIIACLLAQFSFSQTGSVKGKVTDGATGEVLFDVKVSVDSTKFIVKTDFDGNYHFNGLKAGTYSISLKLHGYTHKTIQDVTVTEGIELTVNVQLEPVYKIIKEHTVVHVVKKESVDHAINTIKNSDPNIVIITAEEIAKTPARDVAQVLAKGTGMSIQENKFVVIRGLNDRYNAAYLNDGTLPSSESDRKAFSFDIFPSNMLDNVVIIKTATPDLPAEFAGGIIQINTKSIPSKNFQSLSVSGGYNTITTFKDRVDYKGGKKDWLGMDDGTRAISSAIPSKTDFPITNADQASLAKQFTTDWSLQDKKFTPNMNLQYSLGLNDTLFGKKIGISTSFSYNRVNNFNQTIRRGYSGNGSEGMSGAQIEFDYLDKVYSTQILMGAMANFAIKLNENNKLGFKNLYSINSDDRVINRSGERDPLEFNPTLIKANALWFTSNKIYSGQINGEHHIDSNFKVSWVGSYSSINRTIPNLRRSIYTRLKNLNDPTDPNPADTMYVANISTGNSIGPDYGGGMFFSTNKENIASFKTDLEYNLKKFYNIKSEIKVGGLYQLRNRDFDARQLGYTKYSIVGGNVTFKDSLSYLDQNTIFSQQNMGLIKPGVGGFKLVDGSNQSDAYKASSSITAGYLMMTNKFSKKLRVVWGARAEYFIQSLDALKGNKVPLNILTKKLDILPSLNAVYSIHKKQNLKLAVSQTVNRPEYRELAPFLFYDFNTQFAVSGNDSLKRAKITNLDLRYEYFPGKAQILSGTVFYKKFVDPIEQISRADVPNEVTFKNVPTAINYGFELELRSVLGRLFNSDSSSILNNFTYYANAAIIRSVVDVSDIIGTPYNSRPLQGQSPYVFNTGLMYTDDSLGMSFTMIMNRVGDRIAILGNVNEPDIWEKGRTFVDFQISKFLFKEKMEVKLNFQNILAQKLIFYQNNYFSTNDYSKSQQLVNSVLTGDKGNQDGYNAKRDDLLWSTIFGRSISATVVIRF